MENKGAPPEGAAPEGLSEAVRPQEEKASALQRGEWTCPSREVAHPFRDLTPTSKAPNTWTI